MISSIVKRIVRTNGEPAEDVPSSDPSEVMSKFPVEGLRFSALTSFVSVCGGEKKLRKLTTLQVVERHILPLTVKAKTSYVELVKKREPAVIGRATAYISHSWGMKFLDTLNALKFHFRNDPEAVLWMDIFCLDQHIFFPLRLQRQHQNSLSATIASISAARAINRLRQSQQFKANMNNIKDSKNARTTQSTSKSLDTSTVTSPYDHIHALQSSNSFSPQRSQPQHNTESSSVHAVLGDPPEFAQHQSTADSGASEEWIFDTLRRGIFSIGHIVLVVNPSPLPEPNIGNKANNGDFNETGKNVILERHAVDKARYENPHHTLSRLWCLYELFCASLSTGEHTDGGSQPDYIGATANNETERQPHERDGGTCSFDIALCYSLFDEHGTKNKKSAFQIDTRSTCKDIENLALWVMFMNMDKCVTSDFADAEKLFSVINAHVGVESFINTVKRMLTTWINEKLNISSAIESVSANEPLLSPQVLQKRQSLYIQYSLCTIYHLRGETDRAEGALTELSELQKSKFGPTSELYMDSLHHLGVFYCRLHRYTDAEPLFNECLERRKLVLGSKHVDTLQAIESLAELYEWIDVPHLAEPLYEECYELRKEVLGEANPLTLRAMYGSANMLFFQEEYDLSEGKMRECLNLRRAALGYTHLDTIQSLETLGRLYEVTKNHSAAELIYHEYLHAVTKIYGADHVRTIDCLHLLALNYKHQCKYYLAEQLFRSAIDRYQRTLGHDHDFVLAAMRNLCNLYDDAASYEESLKHRQIYFELCKSRFGEQDPDSIQGRRRKSHHKQKKTDKNSSDNWRKITENTDNIDEDIEEMALPHPSVRTQQAMHDMAWTQIRLGRCSRAEALLLRCLELRQQQLGSDHYDTLVSQNLLAYTYIDRGKFEEAEKLLVEIIEKGEKHKVQVEQESYYGSDSNNNDGEEDIISVDSALVLDAMCNLALLYTDVGRLTEAEALYMNVWETYRRLRGSDMHGDVLMVVNNLASLYVKQEKYDLAEYFFSDCLKKRTTVLGPLHPSTLQTLCNLSALYTLQSKFEIAENMIHECHAQCATVLGSDHPTTLRNLNNLAQNAELQGDFRKAEVLYKQSLVKRRLVLGASHPETLSTGNNLACLYVKMQYRILSGESDHKDCRRNRQHHFKEAERLLKECLKIRQTTVGLRHPDTLKTINNLAALYMRSEKLNLSHDVFTDCYEESLEQLGESHPIVKRIQNNLNEIRSLLHIGSVDDNALVPFAKEPLEDAVSNITVVAASKQRKANEKYQESDGTNYRRARRKK